MSFELIDNIEEKYPTEHFTLESVYKTNLLEIFTKIKNVVINVKSSLNLLQEKINELEDRIKELETAKSG